MRILSEEMIPIAYEFNDICFWVCIIVGLICIAIAVTLYYDDIPKFIMFIGSVALLLISIFIGLLLGGGLATPSEYESHYKVIVDDTVTVNEFLNRYELLERDGEILIVKEIEVEDGDE